MTRRYVGSLQRRGDRWYVRVTRPDGSRTTRGSWATPEAAELALPNVVAEVLAAFQGETQLRESPGLWRFFETEYERVLAGRIAASTAYVTRCQIRQCATYFAKRGAPAMRAIGPAEAEEYLTYLGEDNEDGRALLSSSILHHRSNLGICWETAKARGYVDTNPWRGIQIRRDHERAVPWLSPADLRRVIAIVDVKYRELVQFLAGTGARKGEALGLDWRDVDLKRGAVVFRRTKSRRPREVPLMPDVTKMLETRRGDRTIKIDGPDRVFPDVSKDGLMHALRLAAARCQLPALRVHDLRHVYASHLTHAGVDPAVVAVLLGHTDGGQLVFRRYGRWRPTTAAKQAVELLARVRAPAAARSTKRRGPRA